MLKTRINMAVLILKSHSFHLYFKSYLLVLYLTSDLTNLFLVVNTTMSAETAWKLNFYLESMACLQPCLKRVFDAKMSLVKLLDILQIVENF